MKDKKISKDEEYAGGCSGCSHDGYSDAPSRGRGANIGVKFSLSNSFNIAANPEGSAKHTLENLAEPNANADALRQRLRDQMPYLKEVADAFKTPFAPPVSEDVKSVAADNKIPSQPEDISEIKSFRDLYVEGIEVEHAQKREETAHMPRVKSSLTKLMGLPDIKPAAPGCNM